MDKEVSEAATEMGRKGGLATKKKYGKKHYSEMAKKMLEARWGKKEKKEQESLEK